jgi:hypothetical protein
MAARRGIPIAAVNLGRTRAGDLLTLKVEDRCEAALSFLPCLSGFLTIQEVCLMFLQWDFGVCRIDGAAPWRMSMKCTMFACSAFLVSFVRITDDYRH